MLNLGDRFINEIKINSITLHIIDKNLENLFIMTNINEWMRIARIYNAILLLWLGIIFFIFSIIDQDQNLFLYRSIIWIIFFCYFLYNFSHWFERNYFLSMDGFALITIIIFHATPISNEILFQTWFMIIFGMSTSIVWHIDFFHLFALNTINFIIYFIR